MDNFNLVLLFQTLPSCFSACVFLATLLLPVDAFAQETYQGEVIYIADGDTLTILVDYEQVKLRLANIDAPERGQPYGTKAKKILGNLTFGKKVRVNVTTTDRWGRGIGRLFVDGIDINAEMIRRGYAWVYREYSNDPMFVALEEQAKIARRGLWADGQPVPPWTWRRKK